MISVAKNKSDDLFRQAMGSFETALCAGLSFQEDSARRCTEFLRDIGSPLTWEQTVPTNVSLAVVAMQQHVDQSIRLMNENAQQALNLMELALEMQRTNSNGDEEDGYFWNYAVNAMRTNARIMRQANARVLESWRELAKEVLQRVDGMSTETTRVAELGMRPI